MKKLKLLLCALLIVSLWACNAEKKKLKQKIEAAEAKDKKHNPELAMARAELYAEYADKFTDDTLAPHYLFKAAKIYELTGNFNRSIELYEKLDDNYPNHDLAPEALFFEGFIYETALQDYPRAKAAFEELIKRFPKHQYAEVAKVNLPHVGTIPDFAKELETGPATEDTAADTAKSN